MINRLLLLLVVLLAGAVPVLADPLTIGTVRALQNGGFNQVHLAGNPGAVLTITDPDNPAFADRLEFDVHLFGELPPGTLAVLRFTLDRGGPVEVFDRNLSAPSCCNDVIEGGHFSFLNVPWALPNLGAPPGAQLFTLTVGIIGGPVDPHVYSFYVVKPIPEPATLFLLGTGLTGAVALYRRRKGGKFNGEG